MTAVVDPVLAEDLLRDPWPLAARWRREAPVLRLEGQDVFLVSTWGLVNEAVGRVDDFSNHFRYIVLRHDDGRLGALETGPTGPDVFAGADPPVHTAHRRLFLGDLSPARTDELESDVEQIVDELLDDLLGAAATGPVDAAAVLAHPLPLRVVAERVIHFVRPDLEQLQRWVSRGSRLTGGMLTLDEIAREAGDVAGMAGWVEAQLTAVVTSAGVADAPGVLGTAARAVVAGSLTSEEAAFTLMVLVGAGAETTASLLGLAIALLARDEALQDRLRAEPSLVPAFVEEVLRFDSPFRFHPRTAARDTELGGVPIPQGALVLLLWASANRDGAVFDDPDDFRLGRPNVHQHMGFGRGIHHCIGAPLARLEARVALRRLLERASFRLDPDRPEAWADSVWIHRHEALPLLVEAR